MERESKKSNIFYGKRTIILFIILTLFLLIFSFIRTNTMMGAGYWGIPFEFYSQGISGADPIESTNDFYLIYLLLDLIIYYAIAVLISFGIFKLKKK